MKFTIYGKIKVMFQTTTKQLHVLPSVLAVRPQPWILQLQHARPGRSARDALILSGGHGISTGYSRHGDFIDTMWEVYVIFVDVFIFS